MCIRDSLQSSILASNLLKILLLIEDVFFLLVKNDSTSIVRKHKGDQDWVTELLGGSKVWWPYEWVMSFKWEVLNGGLVRLGTQEYKGTQTKVSQETSILVFHGRPNPEDVTDDIIVNNWK